MSVPLGKRKESSMEFLKNARDIEAIFIDMRIHKPKRYTFFFDRLLDCAIDILNEAKRGNSIYPENQSEARLRIECFKKAIAACQVLLSQVEVIKLKLGEDGIATNQVQIVAQQIDYEIKLLKGMIANDKKRYANLPL